MSQEKIDKRILGLLRRMPRGLTVGEIAASLGELPGTVYKAMERLRESGRVDIVDTIKHGRGRPEEVFALSTTKLEMGKLVIADEVDRQKAIEEKEELGLVLEIIESAVIPSPDFKGRIKAAAQRLKTEDPRKLLSKMAEWLLARYRELGVQYKLTFENARLHAAGLMKERMQKIQEFAFRLYNKQLGIPWDNGKYTGRKGPFILNYDFKNRQDDSHLDPQSLDKFLKLHVQGDAVVEKIHLDHVTTLALAGTDASRQEVWLLRYASPEVVVTRFPTAISVAVATFYSPGKPPRFDAKPEPTEWRRYTLDDALEKGLLVPPYVYINDPDMWTRALEAAMNLRQYVKDHEALFPKPTEPGIWAVHALIRDGRIYPWEHTFSDYARLGEHGRLVRCCLDEFQTLASRVNVRWDKSLYCGAVKQPRVDILVPVVLWYMRYGTEDTPIWPDVEEDIILSGYGLSDQQMASLIFEALDDGDRVNARWVTFQVVRRFYTLAEREYSRLWVDKGGWLKVFEDAVRENMDKGLPTYDDARTYAELCEKTAILSFYIDTGPQSFGPRFEVLLPAEALDNTDRLHTISKNIVRRLSSIVARPGVMEPYKEVWGGHMDWTQADIPLLLPVSCALAHDSSVDVCRDHAVQLEAYLTLQLIKAIQALKKQVGEKV